ncbi:type II toxin-antitoxin system PemK/MazF family toxin [Paenibacillus marinisediminis]
MVIPKRGDLVTLNFNPQSGHEQAGRRPGLVLSPERFNEVTGFAVICPITSQQKGYPFEVELPEGLKVQGVILSDQIKNLDWKARELKIIDETPQDVVHQVLDRVRTFL